MNLSLLDREDAEFLSDQILKARLSFAMRKSRGHRKLAMKINHLNNNKLFCMFCGLLYFLVILMVPDCLAGTEEEITHLLQYIEDSDCIFIRNGKKYGSSQAKNHLELKYKHAKRWIKTAEDFIKYIATKSSLSGMSYMVDCDGQKMPSSKWLKMALFRIRSQ